MRFIGSQSGKQVLSSDGGGTIRDFTLNEVGFSIDNQSVDVITTPGTTGSFISDDLSVATETGSSGYNEFTVDVVLTGLSAQTPTIESGDEAVFTYADGRVTRVSDGTANLYFTTPNLKKAAEITIASYTGEQSVTGYSFANTTLGKHCFDKIAALINGVTANATTKAIFDGNSFNSSCWANSIDLTCLSSNNPSATLITPRHAVGAEHYKPGNTITFIGSDDTLVTRTVTGRFSVPPSNASDNYKTDIHVMTLDSDLPGTVTPCKVVPADLPDYLPSVDIDKTHRMPLPGLVSDQEKKALVQLVLSLYNSDGSRTPIVWGTANFDESLYGNGDMEDFWESKVSGDSGSPMFLIINDEAVLLSTLTYGGVGTGPAYHNYITEINSAIASADANAGISTGYTVTAPDLSAFTNYG